MRQHQSPNRETYNIGDVVMGWPVGLHPYQTGREDEEDLLEGVVAFVRRDGLVELLDRQSSFSIRCVPAFAVHQNIAQSLLCLQEELFELLKKGKRTESGKIFRLSSFGRS